jgi:hypothetical protein
VVELISDIDDADRTEEENDIGLKEGGTVCEREERNRRGHDVKQRIA